MGKNRMPYKKKVWHPERRTKSSSASSNSSYRKNFTFPKPEDGGTVRMSLREDQVGITEFVSKIAGFTGVVKSRFSDFHVNEIDPNGKILHLNDLSVPEPLVETLGENEIAAARDQFEDIITGDVWEQIGALAAMKGSNPLAQRIDINVTSLDKEKRTQLHNILKQLYGQKLVSSTINQTIDCKEERLIRIMKPKGKAGEHRKRWSFPGEYVHFLLYKENIDTTEAASRLASRMYMHPSQINYCGTKDKRAKTTQKFCIKRREPSHILNAAKMSHLRIGNFEFSNDVLKLGDLKGNRFRIALRHISENEKEIEKALENLRDNGFINYFGLQRFGNNSEIPTYKIGVALLKSDYKAVAELILKPRSNDVPFMDDIRKKWWAERDSAAAAAMFKTKDSIEKKLLDGLAKFGESDYSAALRKIPRNMLLLYPHAFQSLVFNRIASRRIQNFGLQLIPGDLVYRNKEETDEDVVGAIMDGVEDNQYQEENVTAIEIDEKIESVTNEVDDSIFKRKVKALSAEDIANGSYTLYDVVLPLPGYDITYPGNELRAWYEEILQEYGLSSEKLRHNVKTFGLAGAYRKLLIRPSDLKWKFRKYSCSEQTLIASDWDNITGRSETIERGGVEGEFKALLLDFGLPRSVYATMLLRELLKNDTSSTNQTQLEQTEISKVNTRKTELLEGGTASTDQTQSEQIEINNVNTSITLEGNENEAGDNSDSTSRKRAVESDGTEEFEEKKSKNE